MPFMMVFNSNGTVVLTTANNGNGRDSVGVGTWVSTGNGQYALTTNQFRYDDNGNYGGNSKGRISLSVSGSQLSGIAELVIVDPAGAVLGDVPGITFTATPIAVEMIGSM